MLLRFCAFPFTFVVCCIGSTLAASIVHVALFVLFLLFHGSVSRASASDYDIQRNFWETLYEWILLGATDTVDVVDGKVVFQKRQDRILRTCIVNKVLMDNANYERDYDDFLKAYLKQKAVSNFAGVTWSDIRGHNCHSTKNVEQYDYRNARFFNAFFYNFYGYCFAEYANTVECVCDEDLMIMMLVAPLTWLFGPIYALTRFVNVLMPFITVIHLALHSNLLVFVKVNTFQTIVFLLHVCALLIWLVGAVVVFRNEFYLWHILPTRSGLDNFGLKGTYDEQNTRRILMEIHTEYYRITWQPLVGKILVRRFGDDVANIIQMYLNEVQMIESTQPHLKHVRTIRSILPGSRRRMMMAP